jgi:hypothetical protein
MIHSRRKKTKESKMAERKIGATSTFPFGGSSCRDPKLILKSGRLERPPKTFAVVSNWDCRQTRFSTMFQPQTASSHGPQGPQAEAGKVGKLAPNTTVSGRSRFDSASPRRSYTRRSGRLSKMTDTFWATRRPLVRSGRTDLPAGLGVLHETDWKALFIFQLLFPRCPRVVVQSYFDPAEFGSKAGEPLIPPNILQLKSIGTVSLSTRAQCTRRPNSLAP